MTSIPAALALVAISPSANIVMRTGLPLPVGRRTSSWILFVGFFRSTSRRVKAISTDSTNLRSGDSSRAC